MTSETSEMINKSVKRAAVIGTPITHSKSPLIHNYFLKKLHIQATYEAIEIITSEDLQPFMDQLRSDCWVGVNVTIPYKENVIPYLDAMDNNVELIGACNTVVNQSGKLIGYNTDAEGFYYPIRKKKVSSIIILGNGGASKSVLYQCAKSKINEITLVARDHAKSMALCKRLEETFNINIKKLSFLSLNKKVRAADIIVNTTSVGMNNQGDSFSLIEDMLKGQIFYDLIYSPWETKMMQVCKSKKV